MADDPIASLGAYLTANEARGLAANFAAKRATHKALLALGPARRDQAGQLLAAAGLGDVEPVRSTEVLQAIAGAKSVLRDLAPVWTMPGNEANIGHLTGQFHHIVQTARQSVVCATYNFEKTSQMWTVLREASEQDGVEVTVYVDGDKADAAAVKAQLPKAVVYRSGVLPGGKRVVSHAKFVIVDHEVLLLTSANFSFSAENRNVEFGLLVRDAALCESVESMMASKRGTLYESS